MNEEHAGTELQSLAHSLTRVAKVLERQEALLAGLSLWVRLLANDQAKSFFEKTLKGDREKWVYEALDGEATQTTIQQRTSVPQPTVSRWVQAWDDLGIVVDVGGGKRRKIISLAALGIDVPPLPSGES
jgi:hypothetical protein